jgi:hypothetical protein
MKPNVFLFIALGLAGVRAAPVPRIQALTQNVCDDKLAIHDCTLVRRGKEDGVSSRVGESAVTAEVLDNTRQVRNEKVRIWRADFKVKDPEGYKAQQNKANQSRKLWRAKETEDQRMKRLQSEKNRRASIAAHPTKGPDYRMRKAASAKRRRDKMKKEVASSPLDSSALQAATEARMMAKRKWRASTAAHPIKGPAQRKRVAVASQRYRDNKKQRLASTPPLVTDTNTAYSSTQVTPPVAELSTVGHDASTSVTQAAHVHSGATDLDSDIFDNLPHLNADDIRLLHDHFLVTNKVGTL